HTLSLHDALPIFAGEVALHSDGALDPELVHLRSDDLRSKDKAIPFRRSKRSRATRTAQRLPTSLRAIRQCCFSTRSPTRRCRPKALVEIGPGAHRLGRLWPLCCASYVLGFLAGREFRNGTSRLPHNRRLSRSSRLRPTSG